MDKQTIKFKAPGKDEPGFLLRARQTLEFKRDLDMGMGPEVIDKMVEFLLPYITEPVDRDKAREKLLQASQNQFFDLIDQFMASGVANPTSPEPSATS